MKLMYAFGPSADLVDNLRDPAWLAQLSAVGVSKVAVGIDDDDVETAQLRLQAGPVPIRAVLSAWTDEDPGPVSRLVLPIAARVTGWAVSELVPLPPPQAPEGVRIDALVNVALLRIPQGMARDDWERRWLEEHTPIAIETQATFGYLQNIVTEMLLTEPADESTPPVAALVEEFFPMAALTDWHAFYGSDGDMAQLRARMHRMAASTAAFGASTGLDLVPTSRYEYHFPLGGTEA